MRRPPVAVHCYPRRPSGRLPVASRSTIPLMTPFEVVVLKEPVEIGQDLISVIVPSRAAGPSPVKPPLPTPQAGGLIVELPPHPFGLSTQLLVVT